MGAVRSKGEEAIERERLSSIAIATRRGRAARRRLVNTVTVGRGHSAIVRESDSAIARAMRMARRVSMFLVFLVMANRAVADSGCANIPICFPPYDPPVTDMYVYEGDRVSEVFGERCVTGARCSGTPFWAPAGGRRTSFWYCASDPMAPVTVTVFQGGVESVRSPVVKLADLNADACWDSTAFQPAYTTDSLKSPSEKLSDLGSICLSDPACAQLVLDKCLGDASCSAMLAPKLNNDFNLDGRVDSTDAAWWAATIRGEIK